LRFQGVCYRAHDPRWAFTPLSGEGAKLKGGRFNPKGVPALYLSLSINGLFREMTHGFSHRMDPLTVCEYTVDVNDILDLRTEDDRNAASIALNILSCPWADDLANGREPASWTLTKRLIAASNAGILVPSFATGASADMTNLVLWNWGPTLPHRVDVHDPSGKLPKDQTSWPAV
jgi:RES domain-containing protein